MFGWMLVRKKTYQELTNTIEEHRLKDDRMTVKVWSLESQLRKAQEEKQAAEKERETAEKNRTNALARLRAAQDEHSRLQDVYTQVRLEAHALKKNASHGACLDCAHAKESKSIADKFVCGCDKSPAKGRSVEPVDFCSKWTATGAETVNPAKKE